MQRVPILDTLSAAHDSCRRMLNHLGLKLSKSYLLFYLWVVTIFLPGLRNPNLNVGWISL